MRRSIIALALGTATLVALPLASADAPKKDKGKGAAEERLHKLEGQVRELKEQQATNAKQVQGELAEIRKLLKAGHHHPEPKKPIADPPKLTPKPDPCADKPKPGGGTPPIEELDMPDGVRLSASAQTATTVTKRYYLVPVSSLAATGLVANQSLALTAAPAVVSQPVRFAAPVVPSLAAPMVSSFSAPTLISSTPVALNSPCAPVQAARVATPYAYSSYASPCATAARASAYSGSNYVINSLPNNTTLQIRGGRSFSLSPSVAQPYVMPSYDASFYGVTENQIAP